MSDACGIPKGGSKLTHGHTKMKSYDKALFYVALHLVHNRKLENIRTTLKFQLKQTILYQQQRNLPCVGDFLPDSLILFFYYTNGKAGSMLLSILN